MNKVLICALLLLCCCAGHQSNPENQIAEQPRKKFLVSFQIDDSIYQIANQFSLCFVHNQDTIRPKIIGNQLLVPSMSFDTGYVAIFTFADYTLSFPHITQKMIFPDQDMKWKFGIENKPFNRKRGLLSDADYSTDSTTRQLFYLQFDPQEFGDGIQFVQKVR